METTFILLLIGVISGIFTGLLGIGGGVITVPALYYLFLAKGEAVDGVMQQAVATSLAVILVTACIATGIHYKKGKSLHYPILGYLIPGLIMGCMVGAELAYWVTSDFLRAFFGGMAFLLGAYFCIPKPTMPQGERQPNFLLTLCGLAIGVLSSFLGVGGGVFTIPLLLAYRVSPLQMAATSSAATLTTSLIGTLTYLLIAFDVDQKFSMGLIDPTSLICLAIGSISTIPFGIKLTNRIPAAQIKQIFGVVIGLTGLFMIFKS